MLKKSRKLKAHQGTIVNGQIVYNEPDTGPVEAPQVNRDIGITRPRNTTVPTEPPVTDTAPAPTPIAPVPAPAPTPAPFVPPRSDPAPVNQPVPIEQPVTDTAPTPIAPAPVAAIPLPATPDVTGTVEPAVMPRGGPVGPVEPVIDEITVDDGIVAAEPTQTMPDPIQSLINLPMPDPRQTRPEVSFPQPLFPRRNIAPQPFMPMPRTQPYRPSPYNPFPSRNPFMRRPMPYNPYGQFPRRGLPRDHDVRPMPIMNRRLSDLINNANRRASRGGLKPNTMPGFLNDMMQTLVRNNNTYRPRGFGNSIGRPMRYNEGGAVMEDQMKFFMEGGTPQEKQLSFFDEGGMKDDGGKKDPVSGNDVPIGSLDQEVRDDVPAMVSEGEFIFPADVTRYIGLDKLMQLRQDAKMGLKKMEMMGQLGNPEDAVLPDDIPFDAADIIILDDEMEEEEESAEEKYQGGVTGFQKGTADPSQSYYNITEEANKPYNKKYVVYQNDAGKTVLVLSTFNGDPLESVPAGYKIVLNPDGSPATSMPERKDKDDDDDKDKDTSVQQYGDDDDKSEKLDAILETSKKAAETTAKRLGMTTDEYLKLPIKTRFNLIGEELKVMGGAEPDLKRIEGIKNGTITSGSGDGIFGFSLLGGIFDTIGTVLDKDGNGSMWSSTVLNPDGTGQEINIFGVPIRKYTVEEMGSFGKLVDGKWQGNLENPYSRNTYKPTIKNEKNNLKEEEDNKNKNKSNTTSTPDYSFEDTRRGSSDKNNNKSGDGFLSASDSSSSDSSSSGSSYTDTSSISGIEKAENQTTSKNDEDKYGGTEITTSGSYGGYSGVAGGRAKGGLANKPKKRITKKKQPTKRKTLLKKRS